MERAGNDECPNPGHQRQGFANKAPLQTDKRGNSNQSNDDPVNPDQRVHEKPDGEKEARILTGNRASPNRLKLINCKSPDHFPPEVTRLFSEKASSRAFLAASASDLLTNGPLNTRVNVVSPLSTCCRWAPYPMSRTLSRSRRALSALPKLPSWTTQAPSSDRVNSADSSAELVEVAGSEGCETCG